VRRSGHRFRITAQLIKVDDGFHLWSHTYDRVLDDVFAIQEEIALAISDALQIELALRPKGLAGQTTNIEAYSAYLLGRQKWNSRAIDQLAEAIDLFRKAVELDPDYALAWSGLADAIDALAYRDQSGYKLLPEGFEAASRAIALAPDQAAGYASLAILQGEFEWDFDAAFENLGKALQLNPVYVPALHWKADISSFYGRYDEQMTLCDRALTLDPLAIIVLSSCGGSLFDSGRDNERAFQMMAKALKLSPDFNNLNFRLPFYANDAGLMGLDEAAGYLKRWATLRDLNEPERMRLFLELKLRPELRPDALQLLSEIEEQEKLNPIVLLYLYAQVGELDRALDLFEALYEIRNPQILASSGNRLLPIALRDHPRFEAVIKKMGLPTRREIVAANN
jgi:tetratricopeptide (TPR) repeat protein